MQESPDPRLTALLPLLTQRVPAELVERARSVPGLTTVVHQLCRRRGRGQLQPGPLTEPRLAGLHRTVRVALTAHNRTQAQWTEQVGGTQFTVAKLRCWAVSVVMYVILATAAG